ncbi:MAG: LD-carboxypeptidase [Alphaproteobacteria bacterium]|nr:LD-carboxypeptidase [Alphaproteobacteria bacterium]
MASSKTRIIVVAPARNLPEGAATLVRALASRLYGDAVDLVFHAQCFLSEGHFAGPDSARDAAMTEAANDPDAAAVWFARGGYGSGRLAPDLFDRFGPAARSKKYLGYSDLGFLLARLDAAGVGQPAHGPMPNDIVRPGGEAAVARALKWLVEDDEGSVEPHRIPSAPRVAFNAIVLASALLASPGVRLAGRILMLEEIGEQLYAFDRAVGAILSSDAARGLAGVRLGRVLDTPENDPPFERTPEEIVRFWCDRVGVPYLGPANIGHDADNMVVPFT